VFEDWLAGLALSGRAPKNKALMRLAAGFALRGHAHACFLMKAPENPSRNTGLF